MKLEEIQEKLKKGEAVLVDVREQFEWEEGHVAGAIHLPLSQLAFIDLSTLPKDKTLLLYCRSGGRTFQAAPFLKNHHPSIVPLKVGYAALKEGLN